MKNFYSRRRVAIGYTFITVFSVVFGWWFVNNIGLLHQWLNERQIRLEEPLYLWGLAAIPVLWIVRLHSLTDTPWAQQWLSAGLRSAILCVLSVALTNPSHIREEPRRSGVVVLVDVSESMSQKDLANARDSVQKLWDARGTQRLRLVTFAREPQVVSLYPDEKGQLPAIERHSDGGRTTDLQRALRLAEGLFEPGVKKRIVVVSDGNETMGNAANELATLQRLGVALSYVSPADVDASPELMVRRLDVPTDIEVNVPFDVTAEILANHNGHVKCTLKVDDLVADVQTVALTGAAQLVDFEPVRVREGGDRAFHVDCVPKPLPDGTVQDQVATNNRVSETRRVPKKNRLLYIEGERMYATNFRDALRDDFEVEVRGAAGLPTTLEKMKRYRAIVVSDVPRQTAYYRDNIGYKQMRLLDEYAQQGGMLLFTGGSDSLGPGGFSDTYLERKVLPVRLDARHEIHTPRLALVLVIDRSGSMSGRKIELAKKAARETVQVLGREDRVGIIAFDSQPIQIIRLTRATNTRRFDQKLRKLKAGGGTAIYPSLDAAFQMLERTQAKIKHVILLSDGQSNRTGVLHLSELMARKKITISTIAIGAGSDRSLLANVAEVGRGRAYYTESAESIPKLFVDETRKVTRDSVVSDGFRPRINPRFARLRFLKGVGMSSAPALDGYVSTQAKPSADVILQTHRNEPLLARWKRGKGWVYVFTSDIKNKWAHRWLRWRGFAPFWRQLIKDGIHKEKEEWVYPAEAFVARGQLKIAVDAVDKKDEFVSGVESTARISLPDGTSKTLKLKQQAPGRYEGTIPAEQYGPYRLQFDHRKDGKKIAISHASVSYPYPEELLRFDSDLTRIASLSEETGGLSDPKADAMWHATGHQSTHREPLWHWLLACALGGFLLDVFLRRVRLWPAKTVRWGAV